ncbi:MAG: alpha/beta fold hydrolase [Sphingopyxis sp.]
MRVTLILLALYLMFLVAIWFAQRSILFPAPQQAVPLPTGYTQVQLHTSDGLSLKAAYRRAEQGKPTIIFFHGNGDNWFGAAIATEAFAANGYGIFLPEYRGYAGNPGAPSEDGLYRDGRAALDWLREQGIEHRNLVIVGNSIGSGVATQMALESDPAALVLISPFASLPVLMNEKISLVPIGLLLRDRFENETKLPEIRGPTLLLHGTGDTLIPAMHAQRLKRAHPAADLVLVQGAGHELAYIPLTQQRIIQWLSAHLEDTP